MKNILIIAFGMMFSCLSASTLPDNVSVVSYEKLTYQAPPEIFADQVLLVDDYAVSDFVVQLKNTVKLQTFTYVADVNVRKSKGFVKPILYEHYALSSTLTNYDIYKVKVPMRNEILFNDRIPDVSKALVF